MGITWWTDEMFTSAPGSLVVEQLADLRLGTQERAAEVDRQDAVERRRVEHVGVLRDLDPGVVDEEVDRTELGPHLLEHPLHRVLVGDVGLDRASPGSACCTR